MDDFGYTLGFASLLDVVIRSSEADERRVEICGGLGVGQYTKLYYGFRGEWGERNPYSTATSLTLDIGFDRVDVVSRGVACNEDRQNIDLVRIGWRLSASEDQYSDVVRDHPIQQDEGPAAVQMPSTTTVILSSSSGQMSGQLVKPNWVRHRPPQKVNQRAEPRAAKQERRLT